MEYTRQQIIDRCQDAFYDIKTFYQINMINYRGKTSDTGEYYTEVIAEFVCNNIKKYVSSIPMITRKASYKTASHTGKYCKNSNRVEEVVAIRMFNQSKKGCVYDHIGTIIDYQTPLKSKRKDVAGKIDLLSYDGTYLRVLELKKPDSTETMLRCVLEGYTYMQTVDTVKLLEDFSLPQDTVIKASPFVFKNGVQHAEMKEERKWLRCLMTLLDSRPFYFIENDEKYYVVED